MFATMIASCGGGGSMNSTTDTSSTTDGTSVPGKLNDTGITFSSNYPAGNNQTCVSAPPDKQDCEQGRDALAAAGTLVKVGNGHAGFDFTKLDSHGQPLADQTQSYAVQPWACVRDNHTGLVWEVKTPAGSGGIHDANNTYRWGGKTALLTGTFGIRYNDWNTLVDGANAGTGLCGYTNWRIPGVNELQTIVNLDNIASSSASVPKRAIDTDYFPNTAFSNYWTAEAYYSDNRKAWEANFSLILTDRFLVDLSFRTQKVKVRLVRSGL